MPLPQDIRPVFQDIQDTLVRSDAPWIEQSAMSKVKVEELPSAENVSAGGVGKLSGPPVPVIRTPFRLRSRTPLFWAKALMAPPSRSMNRVVLVKAPLVTAPVGVPVTMS